MVAEKRTKTVRMTLEQEQEFLKKVKQSGLSQEEYMRRKILEDDLGGGAEKANSACRLAKIRFELDLLENKIADMQTGVYSKAELEELKGKVSKLWQF